MTMLPIVPFLISCVALGFSLGDLVWRALVRRPREHLRAQSYEDRVLHVYNALCERAKVDSYISRPTLADAIALVDEGERRSASRPAPTIRDYRGGAPP